MKVDLKKIRTCTQRTLQEIIDEDSLHENSPRTIRRGVEKAMSLPKGTLDKQPYKALVREIIDEHTFTSEDPKDRAHGDSQAEDAGSSDVNEETQEGQPSSARRDSTASQAFFAVVSRSESAPSSGNKPKNAARSTSAVPSSDEAVKTEASKRRKKVSAASTRLDSDDEGHSRAEPPAKRQKAAKSTSPRPAQSDELQEEDSGQFFPDADAVDAGQDDAKSESEMSVLEDEPIPAKRKKHTGKASRSASRREKTTKTRKRKEPAKELSKDEETIKRLKSLVVACGVRKVWAKEFKDIDQPSDQIRRLRQILSDLGMAGRMSLEQAKAIKERRELAQELEDVQEFAQKMESASRRRERNSPGTAEIPYEDSDVAAAPKRRITARQSIMAFLGDEDESD